MTPFISEILNKCHAFHSRQVKMSLESRAFKALHNYFPNIPPLGEFELKYTFFLYYGVKGEKCEVPTVGHGHPIEIAVTKPILGGYETYLPVKDGSHGICLLLVGGVIMGALQ